jgi:hypothetical protein
LDKGLAKIEPKKESGYTAQQQSQSSFAGLDGFRAGGVGGGMGGGGGTLTLT